MQGINKMLPGRAIEQTRKFIPSKPATQTNAAYTEKFSADSASADHPRSVNILWIAAMIGS